MLQLICDGCEIVALSGIMMWVMVAAQGLGQVALLHRLVQVTYWAVAGVMRWATSEKPESAFYRKAVEVLDRREQADDLTVVRCSDKTYSICRRRDPVGGVSRGETKMFVFSLSEYRPAWALWLVKRFKLDNIELSTVNSDGDQTNVVQLEPFATLDGVEVGQYHKHEERKLLKILVCIARSWQAKKRAESRAARIESVKRSRAEAVGDFLA
jgi:hypothetical protein